jgi:F-type H+-transporting ATPase subunit b
MPQFDKITFFNQIFWLFFFFTGYYFLLLKVFLPKLGSVLKARNKKLQKGTQGVAIFAEEQETVASSFNSSVEKITSVVKKVVSDSSEKTTAWVDSTVSDLNTTNLKESNSMVESLVYKQLAATYLLSKVGAK